jgi:hypothetical protein
MIIGERVKVEERGGRSVSPDGAHTHAHYHAHADVPPTGSGCRYLMRIDEDQLSGESAGGTYNRPQLRVGSMRVAVHM